MVWSTTTSYGVLGSATNPDPWSKRRLHSGGLYESGDGTNHRNFEVWTSGPRNVVRHYYRDGGNGNWSLAGPLPQVTLPSGATGYDCAGAPTATGSTYFRNFEVIYRTTGGKTPKASPRPMLHQFLFDQLGNKWIDRGLFGPTDVDGVPGFVQTNVGGAGQLRGGRAAGQQPAGELVARRRGQQRDLGPSGPPSARGSRTAGQLWWSVGRPMVLMTVGVPAGLDYVCVTDAKTMQRWWRDDPEHYDMGRLRDVRGRRPELSGNDPVSVRGQ